MEGIFVGKEYIEWTWMCGITEYQLDKSSNWSSILCLSSIASHHDMTMRCTLRMNLTEEVDIKQYLRWQMCNCYRWCGCGVWCINSQRDDGEVYLTGWMDYNAIHNCWPLIRPFPCVRLNGWIDEKEEYLNSAIEPHIIWSEWSTEELLRLQVTRQDKTETMSKALL